MVHLPIPASEQDECHLSLAEEQFVASHHTQLAMVTALCQEEMVLLKQINTGQKVSHWIIMLLLLLFYIFVLYSFVVTINYSQSLSCIT